MEPCPTSQGWTDRRKHLQEWLPSNTSFLHAPGQGSQLNSRYTGKEKGIQDVLLPRKKIKTFFLLGGEKVLVPLHHSLALTKVTAASQSRHRGRAQPLPQHPPPTCEQGRDAGQGSRSRGMRGGCRIPESFSCCSVPCSQLALGADTDTTDGHAHTAHGPESLYKHALGPAAARASHFLLHVVVQLEFGLVGQLHGPVLQLLGDGCER